MARIYKNIILSLNIILASALISYLAMTNSNTAVASTGTYGAVAGGLGLALAAIYGVIGLGYLYYGAKDAYNGKTLGETITSRLFNHEGLSFKGLMQSIGAVIWSPFLILGGLLGKGVKALVNVYNHAKSSEKSNDNVLPASGSGSNNSIPDLSIVPTGPKKPLKFFATYNPAKNRFEEASTSLPAIIEGPESDEEIENFGSHDYGCCK